MLREHRWLQEEGMSIRVTASMGVASYPADAKSKVELLHLADEAMYSVKNSTRDAVASANQGVLPAI
jgi:diguanylate cyclase (GGDEF)-like protein